MRKKRNNLIYPLILMGLFIVVSNSCKKEDIPKEEVLELSTEKATYITSSTALCGGTITSDGGAAITARGVCWNTSQKPTIDDYKTEDGEGTGSFASDITGLEEITTYFVRAYATNSNGTGYGNEISFTTYGTVTDIDGNTYKTVLIDDIIWMAENLKTTRYNDGSTIPNVTDTFQWASLKTPAYCWYNNNETAHKDTYGALYNWFTVNTDNLCPNGWHVPRDDEWLQLIKYIGGIETGGHSGNGYKLKETGTSHWSDPNHRATNETGFTALPGGSRNSSGIYSEKGKTGSYWSSTEYGSSAWSRHMYNESSMIDRFPISKRMGISVRCIKD